MKKYPKLSIFALLLITSNIIISAEAELSLREKFSTTNKQKAKEIENAETYRRAMEPDIKKMGDNTMPAEYKAAIHNHLDKFSFDQLKYIEDNASTKTMKSLASDARQKKEKSDAEAFYKPMDMIIQGAGEDKITPEDKEQISSNLDKYSPDTLRHIENNAKTKTMQTLASQARQKKEPTFIMKWFNKIYGS